MYGTVLQANEIYCGIRTVRTKINIHNFFKQKILYYRSKYYKTKFFNVQYGFKLNRQLMSQRGNKYN